MIDVRASDLGEAHRALRDLLVWGLVTDTRPNAQVHARARRHAAALDAALQSACGYRVQVHRGAVRLVRRHDGPSPRPSLATPSGAPFDRFRYALTALTLAGLERSGPQITLSDLAIRVRRASADLPLLSFDPEQHGHRVALGQAVRALQELGVLRLTDGSIDAWERGDVDAEALYDVDLALARVIAPLPRGVYDSGGASAWLHPVAEGIGRDPQRRERRHRLIRLLLEQPVVYYADLDDALVAYARREAASIAHDLESLTGAVLERRAEGLALLDVFGRFSDAPFPKGGSAQQVALLLADRLCAIAEDAPTTLAPHREAAAVDLLRAVDGCAPLEVGATEPPPLGIDGPQAPFVDDQALAEAMHALLEDVGAGLKAAYQASASHALADAIGVLAAHDLVRPVAGGVALMPALARFRAPTVHADPALAGQLGLFGVPG